MGVIVFVGGGAVLRWIGREHHLANLYRKGHVASSGAPAAVPGNQWKITYTAGRGSRTVTVAGDTEAKALAAFVKSAGVKYNKIVSMERI